LHKPLHVIYKVSKLAYRTWVILIANKRVKKTENYRPYFSLEKAPHIIISVTVLKN
jgi:hypothetical protein